MEICKAFDCIGVQHPVRALPEESFLSAYDVNRQQSRFVMSFCRSQRGICLLDERRVQVLLRTVHGYIQPWKAHDIQVTVEVFRADDATNGNISAIQARQAPHQ